MQISASSSLPRYSRARHRIDAMHVHLIFVTKYRLRVLTPDMFKVMRSLFEQVCLEHDAALVEANGETDHVHLIVRYRPTLSIPALVQKLKRQSSQTLLADYPRIKAAYIRLKKWNEKNMTGETRKTDRLWSPSYFVESTGRGMLASLETYVRNQDTKAHKAKRKSRASAKREPRNP